MTLVGHRATGLGAAAIAFSVVYAYDGLMPYLAAALAFPGATAPDWLEVASFKNGVRQSWIKHRTWTHWLPVWVGLFVWGFLSMHEHVWAVVVLGFAVGGLMHLAMDIPNPSGIRILHPYRQRVSFNWWRGDQMVWPLVYCSWFAGLLALHWAGVVHLHVPEDLRQLLEQAWHTLSQKGAN